ncbi:MAG: hypothetical protein K0S35_587 [Geminicoccaceae bacterium]|nr:hypothetical protein [Geminicoccaceae bacterium]
MPAGFELSYLLPWRIDAARARRVGEGHHAIGVADVERIAHQRHAERLVQPLQKHVPNLRHAVAVRFAQPGDPVRTDPRGGGALHRAEHGVVEQRPGRSGRSGRLPRTPPLCRRHLEGRDTLRLRRRDRRSAAQSRLIGSCLPPSQQDRGGADQRDHSPEDARQAHCDPSSDRTHASRRQPRRKRGGPSLHAWEIKVRRPELDRYTGPRPYPPRRPVAVPRAPRGHTRARRQA